ncbi:MAG: hypothetical protein ABIG39_02560 [Candidatus Micrarchaeota archaeon]
MASKCIVCGKNKTGVQVSEDMVIRSIRRIKQVLGIAKNNKLVVCKKCIPEHTKKRAAFEGKIVRYGGFGIIILIVFLLLSLSIKSLVAGIFITLLMLSFTLTDYYPTIRKKNQKPRSRVRKAKKK